MTTAPSFSSQSAQWTQVCSLGDESYMAILKVSNRTPMLIALQLASTLSASVGMATRRPANPTQLTISVEFNWVFSQSEHICDHHKAVGNRFLPMGVWRGVAEDARQFNMGLPCPTLLFPCRRSIPEKFQGWPTRRAGGLRPSSTPLYTPRRKPMFLPSSMKIFKMMYNTHFRDPNCLRLRVVLSSPA